VWGVIFSQVDSERHAVVPPQDNSITQRFHAERAASKGMGDDVERARACNMAALRIANRLGASQALGERAERVARVQKWGQVCVRTYYTTDTVRVRRRPSPKAASTTIDWRASSPAQHSMPYRHVECR
jgi:hypothetical protein